MPPEEAPQPKAEAVAEVVQMLQKRILAQRPVNPLKRLTRAEYTNTMRDLFGVDFDFTGLLPPDHVEHGFDKFGEAHLMSPHQVMAYLKTARFIAERVLPDAKPKDEDVGIRCATFSRQQKLCDWRGWGLPRWGRLCSHGLSSLPQQSAFLHRSGEPRSICHSRFRGVPARSESAFGQIQAKARSSGSISGTGVIRPAFEISAGSPCRMARNNFTTELTLKCGRPAGLHFR